jgi:hypothetical protein
LARNRKSCAGVAATKGTLRRLDFAPGGDGESPIACPRRFEGASQLGPGLTLGLFFCQFTISRLMRCTLPQPTPCSLAVLSMPVPGASCAKNYRLSDDLRNQLTEVVNGYIGRCDEDAARTGIEWMRERYREAGQTPRF